MTYCNTNCQRQIKQTLIMKPVHFKIRSIIKNTQNHQSPTAPNYNENWAWHPSNFSIEIWIEHSYTHR